MLLFRLGTSGSMAISVKSPPLPLVGKLVVFVKNKEDKVYFKWHSRNLPNNFFFPFCRLLNIFKKIFCIFFHKLTALKLLTFYRLPFFSFLITWTSGWDVHTDTKSVWTLTRKKKIQKRSGKESNVFSFSLNSWNALVLWTMLSTVKQPLSYIVPNGWGLSDSLSSRNSIHLVW